MKSMELVLKYRYNKNRMKISKISKISNYHIIYPGSDFISHQSNF